MPEHVPIKSYVFFDCETTGLTAPRITEISFVAVHLAELELYCKHLQTLVQAQMSGKGNVNGFARHAYPRVLSKLTLAVNPMKRIDPMAEEITGLSNYSLEHQAKFKDGPAQTIGRFLESLGGPVCLVAHNGNRFDFPVLQKEMERAGLKLREDILGVDSIVFLRDFYKKREIQTSGFTPESFSKVARPLPFTEVKIPNTSAIAALEPEITKNETQKPDTDKTQTSPILKLPGRDGLVTNPESEALLAVLEAEHEAKRWTTQRPETKALMKLSVIDNFLAEADYKAKLEVRRKTPHDSQPHFSLELPEIEDDENKNENEQSCVCEEGDTEICIYCEREFIIYIQSGNDSSSVFSQEDCSSISSRADECLLNVLHCSHEFSTPTKQDGLLQQSPFMTPPHSAKKRPGLKEDGNEIEIKMTKPDVLSSPLQAKPDVLYPPLQNKPLSFSLPAVYKHLFGEEPEQSHGSEIDSLVLMKILAMYSTAFSQWAGENATLLTNMKARK
ncbi:uncharacterized protein LOC111701651 [Eurytemora carolleeae]|uniref:uncharacterized protein LOC111701651 n=1 Tax=Eurytemora carolleeae TaxID=1294199 RepID=UPI000C786A55|nr:uncharacterized protein LOC111701651 [Eurytemora carolleeae]|eukprot:XP_023328799.1 uncharacterized protein LOC111701651 [Eurytemora affinis]